jgi:serine/threonine protein kinase/tetratricopeptide (TPR) repeat protein
MGGVAAEVAGRYRIEETIGQGGMGIVYRAIDLRTGETVALKQLRREATNAKPDLIERFLREAAALRDLNHPNIVRAFETVTDAGDHYIVMDYVDGSDLGDFLRRYGRIPLLQTVRIGLELADALTRAHYLKIVHRDLKPANVLIHTAGTPKLTDFGVAYFAGRERVTDSSVALGTPQYMAPEMLRGEPPDARADIWSLGVILFELLTGSHPFGGATITDLLMNIMTGEPPDLEALRPETPVELADLIYRMLAKERDARIPSVRLVGSELEPILLKLNADGRLTPMAVPIRRTGDYGRQQQPRTVRNNIPTLPVPFIGRDTSLGEVINLLNLPDVRLLTVLGPGGVGKTRLVIEAARRMAELSSDATDTALVRYINGVFFVPLASLNRPELLPGAIASAIGFRFAAGSDQRAQLINYMREKAMLLVIDSADRALSSISLISEMLHAAPKLKVLTTSRARLNLMGETVYTLEGLWIEENAAPERIAETSAYKLFVASARRARPGFEPNPRDSRHIARIVRFVGGLPLGIELAAAWVNQLTIEEIAAEVERSLDFLDSGDHDRHGSLRAVFEQSWNLLSDDERTTLTRIAVFRGRFSRAAGQTVTGASLRQLMNLVNKGILRRSPDTDIYQIDELTRQYAEIKLNQSPEVAVIRDAHMRYYIGFLDERAGQLFTREQRDVLRLIEAEINNIRSAWFRAVKYGQVAELATGVMALALYFDMVGQYDEAEEVVAPAIESMSRQPESASRDAALSYLHMWRSILQSTDGDPVKARESLEAAELLLNEETSLHHRYVLALAQGMVQLNYGDPVEARPCFAQATELLNQLGGGPELSRTLISLGRSYYYRLGADAMDLDEARRILTEARDVALETGDEYHLAFALFCLGTVAMYARDIDTAERLLRHAETNAKSFGSLHIAANALNNLGYGLMDAGRLSDARACMEENLAIRREQGNPLLIVWALFAVHQIEFAEGLYEASYAHALEGLRLIGGTSYHDWECNMYYAVGQSEWMLGQPEAAEARFHRMYEIADDIRDRANMCLATNHIGITRFSRGQYDEARAAFDRGMALAERYADPNMIAANRVWLGRVGLAEARYEESQRYLIEALEYLVSDEQQRPSYTWTEANRFDYIAIAHSSMAAIAMRRGNLTSARERLWLAMRAALRIGGARMLLRTLSGVAELLSLRGEPLRAVEWCSAILQHPRCAVPNRRSPEAVLERIRKLIPADEYDAAIDRGKLIGLDELVAESAIVLMQS